MKRLYFLLSIFLIATALASGPSVLCQTLEPEERWGIDYPGYITKEAIDEYPKLLDGCYRRTKYAETVNNPVLSEMIEIVLNTDVEKLLGIKNWSLQYLRISAYDFAPTRKIYSVNPVTISSSLPERIGSLNEGYKEIYIESYDQNSKGFPYVFAYGNQILFTNQWFDGLMQSTDLFFNFVILDGPKLFGIPTIWRFVLQDGEIIESSVSYDQWEDRHIKTYNFQTKELTEIQLSME